MAENTDPASNPTPTRALGTRPVVEYVPMTAATHERDPLGYATSALPLIDMAPG